MTKQKELGLEINLNEIKNPHPEMLKAYKEAGAENLYRSEIPANINEERCFLASQASGKPIKHLITALYRQQIKGREWCYFGEELFTQDYFGNTVMHYRQVGKYEKPVINKIMGINPAMLKDNSNINAMMEAQTKQIEIDHLETVFEFPWEDIKPQLIKWKEEGIISDEVQPLVIIGSQKYSKPYTWNEWLNFSIDDLELLARAGRSFQIREQDLTPEVLQKLREKLNANAIEQIGKTK